MGHPKHARKKYSRPKKPWDRKRLDIERVTKSQYGLKNKRELWMIESFLRKKRHGARKLLAKPLEQRIKIEKDLIASLNKIGLLDEKATLDDVLTLKTSELLERRLETIVYRKALANSIKQARQFIVHGHIALNGKKITKPSYIVKRGEDAKIAYYGKPMELAQKKTKEEIKKEFSETVKRAKIGKKAVEKEEAEIIAEAPAEAGIAEEKEAVEGGLNG